MCYWQNGHGYTAGNRGGADVKNILGAIGKAFIEILPAFLFFLVMFHVVLFTRMLTLREFGITPHASAVAIIGALLVAKVIFIADKFAFLNFYPHRPLIWNVLLKTAAYCILIFLFLYVEELFHLRHRYGSFASGYGHLRSAVVWPIFWTEEIWLTVLLFFYCTAVELVRVIGAAKVKEIFFKRGK